MSYIVDQFWNELSYGLPVSTADSSLLRACEFQQQRLEDEGLVMRTVKQPYGHFPDGWEVRSWKDEHYRSTVTATTAKYDRYFYKKGQAAPFYKDSDQYMTYTNVTDCLDYTASGNDSYVCPNCGHVATLNELSQGGCTYCGTRFSMSELYPRVSGYYAVKDVGAKKEEIKEQIFRCIKPLWIAFEVIALIVMFLGMDLSNPLGTIERGIWLAIIATFYAFLFGYLWWVGKKLLRLFVETGRALPKLSALGSSKAFTEQMRQYSGEFSYEYFTDKVISLLKTVIYAKGDNRFPFYMGTETTQFDHVVEASFSGALGMTNFTIQDGIATVQVQAFMENYYSENGRIKKKSERIHLVLQKDLRTPINYHFNIRALQCPTCGSSFDALTNRTCPYCGNQPNMLQQDWVIVDIR